MNIIISLQLIEDPIWLNNYEIIGLSVIQITGSFCACFVIPMYMIVTDTMQSQHAALQTFQIVCIPLKQRLFLATNKVIKL